MTVAARFLRGFAALVVLAALLVGVPAALWHYIGWPLPHAIPSWSQLRTGLTSQGIPDATLLKTLAVVAWLAWASLAASVWTEAVATARGRAARRLPGLAPVQAFAGQLVAAVLLVVIPAHRITTNSPHDRPALVLAAHPASAGSPRPMPQVPAGAVVAVATSPPAASAASQTTYTVKRRDTLWGIAQDHLGDPLRWPDVFQLNRGRPQPDGGSLTNPNLIRPGWTLLVPSAAPAAPVAPAPPASSPAPSAAAPASPPTPALPEGTAATTRPRPATPTPAQREGETSRPAASPHHAPRRSHPGIELPAGSLVGLSFAAGVATALAASRLRRRAAYQPSPPQPGLSFDELQSSEALRRLRRATANAGDGTDAAKPATEPEVATPGVFTVGHHAGRDLSLDLLDRGIDITGPGALDVIRALLIDVLTNHRPDRAAILIANPRLAAELLGDDRRTGVEVVPDLTAALARLEVEVIRRTRLLAEADADDYRAYARAHSEEPLPILIALHGAPDSATEARLGAVESVAARLGIAMIGVDIDRRARRLVVAADGTMETPANPDFPAGGQLYHVSAVDARQVLRAVVSKDEPNLTDHLLTDPTAWPPAPPTPRVEAWILGPEQLLVDGDEVRTGLRAKARELLAYLACHPDGVTWEAAADALWPEVDPQRGNDRFRTVVANLRTAGGRLTDHDDGIVERVGERYRLNAAAVRCDLWLFQAALARAQDAAGDQDRVAALEEAARLYRGALCEGGDGGWIEAVREDLRRRALDVIVRLAEVHDQQGDRGSAVGFLERGIEIDPFAEALYQRLIKLYGQVGRADAARKVYSRLARHLDEIDADPGEDTRTVLDQAVATGSSRLSVVKNE